MGRIGFRTWRSLRKSGALPWRAVAGILVAALLLVGLAALFSLPPDALRRLGPLHVLARSLRQLPQGHEWPLPHHTRKVETMTGCAFVVGFGAIIGVWLVGLPTMTFIESAICPSCTMNRHALAASTTT